MASRLAGFIIDCQGSSLAVAREFWSAALGLPIVEPDEGGTGRYAVLSRLFLSDQLVGDPEQQNAADDLEVGQL